MKIQVRGKNGLKKEGMKKAASLVLAALLGTAATAAGTVTATAGELSYRPQAVTQGPDGSLLVADCYSKVIWKVAEDGRTVFAGKPGPEGLYGEPSGGYGDGRRADMRMDSPWDIVPYLDGYAVSDTGNNVVRYIDSDGSKTLAGRAAKGYEDNRADRAYFSGPTGLAADGEGNLYIADTGNDCVRRIKADGMVETVLRGLSGPVGLCWHEGALYVADTGNHRVLKVENGNITWSAGGQEGMADGSADQARFSSPTYLTVSGDGTIYVSDTGNGAVRRIKDGTVSTVAWDEVRYPGRELVWPAGLLAAEDGLYVCDRFSGTIFVLSK